MTKMTNVKFPKAEIEKHFKLTEEALEKINLLGTPIEGTTEEEIILDILPNRPDLLSLQGWLRAFKAFIGKETRRREYKILRGDKSYKVKIDPSTKNVRPCTACAIIKNLTLNDEKIKEIIDLQEKLHITLGRKREKIAIGIYPLEKISLPITFTALKPSEIRFRPLEADEEMTGREILEKHPKGKEYAHLLQGAEEFPIFKDAKEKILSMPPIINSHETGKITQNTREIFIECSGFDLSLLKKTLNILATTLADMGGEIHAIELDYGKKEYTPDLKPEKMKISLEKTNKLLGLSLKEKDLEKLLPKMGYNYKKKTIEIPAWRTDILHEVDIIEDIAIAYGYNNFTPQIHQIATIGEELPESRIKAKIAEILIGLEFLELSSYHLIKQEEAKLMKSEAIEVENAKTEYKILRPNLLIPLLRILGENKDAEYPQKLFELGVVFKKDSKEETGVKEHDSLIIAITPGNFTAIKQILDYLMKTLNLHYTLQAGTAPELIEGRTAKILLQGKEIGSMGEVHPLTLRNGNLKMPLAVLEISLEEVYKILNPKTKGKK